jgi:hypothetical protein
MQYMLSPINKSLAFFHALVRDAARGIANPADSQGHQLPAASMPKL